MSGVGLGFIPRETEVSVRPLRWFEFLLPWRWPRSKRESVCYTKVELLEVSLVKEPPDPNCRIIRE